MAAVIGLMAVAAVVVVSLMTATVFTTGVTVATRASVQAKAAAEAGVDATAALFKASGCTSTVPSGTDPLYSVTVYSGSQTSQGTPGCTGGDYKRVVSVGRAGTVPVGGNTSGQTRTMEAVFYLPSAAAPSPGYAILGGSATNATNNLQVNASGDVYVTTGDFNCSVAATITGSLFVPGGKAIMSNECRVNGSVYARDGADLSSHAYIGGSLTAPSGGLRMSGGGSDVIGQRPWIGGNASVSGDVYLQNSTVLGNVTSSGGQGEVYAGSRVTGDFRVAKKVVLNGAFTISGMVTSPQGASESYGAFTIGSLRVASLNSLQGGSKFNGDVVITSAAGAQTGIDGSIVITGQLKSAAKFNAWADPTIGGVQVDRSTINSATGGYGQLTGLTPATAPAAPTVQAAVEFPRVTFKPTDWQALGFTVVTWPAGSACTDTNNAHWMSQTLSSYGSAVVVDTRTACPGGLEWNNTQTIQLKANVAIIATNITTTNNFYIQSGDGATHTMWMIIPAAESGAICQYAGGKGKIAFSVGYGSAMPLMLYSPCQVSLTNSQTFPGQVWGANLSLSVDTTINYTPIGIPGVTVAPAGTPPAATPSTLQLLSKRDTTG
ncbi:hypothetical protein [Cellulomonas hominis]|uniref:hypothetical protein n=1 Tax=Cellulomonas hominis TaxID=156981 RepID=UPI001443AE1E|nr:hypothetical protein [Cellulomonas hominis]NKY10388.1 hypothetical protein [Cellulomonas hominis]